MLRSFESFPLFPIYIELSAHVNGGETPHTVQDTADSYRAAPAVLSIFPTHVHKVNWVELSFYLLFFFLT